MTLFENAGLSRDRAWTATGVGSGVLGLAFIFLAAFSHAWLAAPAPPDADALYPASLAADLVAGRPLEWWVPPSNGFVPDLALALLAAALSLPPGLGIAFGFAGFAVLLTMALRAFLIAGGIGQRPAASAAFAVVTLVILAPSGGDALSLQILWPGFHQGILPLELAAFALALDQRRWPASGRGMVLALLVGVAIFADRLALVQAAIPLALVALTGDRRDRDAVLAPVILGAAVGLTAGQLLGFLPGLHVGPVAHQNFALAVRGFLASLEDPGPVAGWPRMLAAFFCIGGVAALVLYRKPLDPQADGHRLVLVVGVISFLAPLLTGLWVEPRSVRYQLPAYLLPPAWLLAVGLEAARHGPWPLRRPGLRWFEAGCALVAIWGSLPRSDAPAPAAEAALGDALRAGSYRVALAEYWNAKPLALADTFPGPVCQISLGMAVYTWIVNVMPCIEAWRVLADGAGEAAVLGDRLVPDPVVARLGPPLRVERIGAATVMVYPADRVRTVLGRDLCIILSHVGSRRAAEVCAPTITP